MYDIDKWYGAQVFNDGFILFIYIAYSVSINLNTFAYHMI